MRVSYLLLALAIAGSAAHAEVVEVQSCGRQLEFDQPPERAVSNDSNLTEMMLALGLSDRMIGHTGISDRWIDDSKFADEIRGLPSLAPRYPSKEVLVGSGADFYFAGWNYGLKVGGEVTPESLAPFGIAVYELTESCIHVGPKPKSSMEDMYADLLNLGAIFGVRNRAETLVETYRSEIAELESALPPAASPIRAFVYDSGTDIPFTAGRFAMPTALIEAAGGTNIVDDLPKSWATVSWETVVERAPEVIIIVDYGEVTAEQKQGFLVRNPAFKDIPAVRDRRFVVLGYAEATPGPRNIDAAKKLAEAFRGR